MRRSRLGELLLIHGKVGGGEKVLEGSFDSVLPMTLAFFLSPEQPSPSAPGEQTNRATKNLRTCV